MPTVLSESFFFLADLFPEALVFVANDGRLIMTNQSGRLVLGLDSQQVKQQCLTDFVVDPPEKLLNFLRLCSRSRNMIPGVFTWRHPTSGQETSFYVEGAIAQPAAGDIAPILLLRWRPHSQAIRKFIELNEQIQQLSKEMYFRQKATEADQERRALLVTMQERHRLAQDLHDTVAQALGYLNLKAGMTYTALTSGHIDAAQAGLQELKQIIAETYTDVREEIFHLRAQTHSDLSFMELLNRYVDKYRRFYDLDIQLIQEADPALFEFSAEATSQLIRTIQESLINVRKHARVNTAVIRLGQEEDGAVRISIEDHGQGFNPDKTKGNSSSFGLQIMRERMESVGGSIEVDTTPDQGTRVVLRYKV